jgi:hypothetical protein
LVILESAALFLVWLLCVTTLITLLVVDSFFPGLTGASLILKIL